MKLPTMKHVYLTLAAIGLAAASAFAQFDATITVTDLGTGLPLVGADVLLDGNFQSTDAFGEVVFTGLADNTYDYMVMKACYTDGLNSITIAGANNSSSIALEARTTNTVFFFIGSPLAIPGATVELTDGMNYFDSFVTSTEFNGDNIEGVPYGEISYIITLPCYGTITGTVIVDCNNGDGVAVFAEPVEATTNNLFFFVGSPFIITGATVEITDGADYFASIVTSDPFGDMIEGVPYGEISYIITLPCYGTITGTVTVDCNNGDGVAVLAEPVEATTNNVFLFIGSPLVITGATVTLTDGADYNVSLVTSDPFGDMVEGVPYGEISYTIALPCYEPISGTLTVDCNNGDGIALFAEPTPITIDASVTLSGATLTAAAGLNYQWIDCANNNEPIVDANEQSYTATANGSYAVIVTDGDCEEISACTTVTVTGVAEQSSDIFAVFPNPFAEQLTVRTSSRTGMTRVEMFDVSGQLVLDETRTSVEILTIATNALPPGSYVLRLTNGSARTSLRVVK